MRPDPKQDVANFGFVRPPFVYLAAILGGVALHLAWPLRWLPVGLGVWLGAPLVLCSFALFFASTRQFKTAGTPVPGNEPTIVIVQAGPYRFSRNPIYLAFSVLGVAIACWLNSAWLLGTLAAAVTLMSLIVIPREERYLERRFGAKYLEYKTRVRRWLWRMLVLSWRSPRIWKSDSKSKSGRGLDENQGFSLDTGLRNVVSSVHRSRTSLRWARLATISRRSPSGSAKNVA